MGEGRVIKDDLSLDLLVRELAEEWGREGYGAVCMFIGVVKGRVEGKEVKSLEYEAYEPYSSEILRRIAEEEEGGEIAEVRIYHAVGALRPGDISLVISVVGLSREVAIEKLRKVLERVKHEVPIFKLERREDGDYWVIGDGKRERRAD